MSNEEKITSLRLTMRLKNALDAKKVHPRETYEDLLWRFVKGDAK